jgi:hypothetical protein
LWVVRRHSRELEGSAFSLASETALFQLIPESWGRPGVRVISCGQLINQPSSIEVAAPDATWGSCLSMFILLWRWQRFFLAVISIKPRALNMLGKCSTLSYTLVQEIHSENEGATVLYKTWNWFLYLSSQVTKECCSIESSLSITHVELFD